jgi:hypothetical protein
MTWGQYCPAVGVVAAFVVCAFCVHYANHYKCHNIAISVLIVVASSAVFFSISSISYLDRNYIAQEKLKAANAKKEEEFQSRVGDLAAQLYEEHLETAPVRELIVFIKNRNPPDNFVEAARVKLQSQQ